MKFDNNSLMEEFHNTFIKERYPDITMEESKEICKGPWKYFLFNMESGNFLSIRFKYFGTFVVWPKRALMMLEKLRYRFKKQRIYPDKYERKKEAVLKFLENENNIR
jgi:hypothetical protein